MILHVDMDAFYASVEERDEPSLVGKPLIVGGTPDGRGVVAAANYAVRKFGVHSAMPTSTALRLCPAAVVLPPRMEHYAAISEQIREIFARYSPLVEPLSLDEAFLDVTGCEAHFGDPIARQIKQAIAEELHLVASVGVAPNKFLAKIASDLNKPDALVVVDPERVQEFLDPLPVSRLWGVGRVTDEALQTIGIRTIRQLRMLDQVSLRQRFGSQGEHLWRLAHGIDQRAVVPDRSAKSISHETTFATDIDEAEMLESWLWDLTEHVGRRLRKAGLNGRTVNLKLRFADFRTITRSQTLAQPTNSTDEIGRTVAELLRAAIPRGGKSIRLLGIGVSGLAAQGEVQLELFAEEEAGRQSRLDSVADAIQKQFGSQALGRGSRMLHGGTFRPEPRATDPTDKRDD